MTFCERKNSIEWFVRYLICVGLGHNYFGLKWEEYVYKCTAWDDAVISPFSGCNNHYIYTDMVKFNLITSY